MELCAVWLGFFKQFVTVHNMTLVTCIVLLSFFSSADAGILACLLFRYICSYALFVKFFQANCYSNIILLLLYVFFCYRFLVPQMQTTTRASCASTCMCCLFCSIVIKVFGDAFLVPIAFCEGTETCSLCFVVL